MRTREPRSLSKWMWTRRDTRVKTHDCDNRLTHHHCHHNCCYRAQTQENSRDFYSLSVWEATLTLCEQNCSMRRVAAAAGYWRATCKCVQVLLSVGFLSEQFPPQTHTHVHIYTLQAQKTRDVLCMRQTDMRSYRGKRRRNFRVNQWGFAWFLLSIFIWLFHW